MEIETRVTEKARHILGIGPIYQQSIDHFYHIVGDYEEAKRMAAQEYLRVQLRFKETEIEDIVITDTQVSAKGENVLYIVTNDEGAIRDIIVRMAQCQDPDLYMQDFIPPQLYKRYMSLNKFAMELRQKDKRIKTQLRYGIRDVELWTKIRGSDERYERMKMEVIEDEVQLPKFDHSLRWKRRQERRPVKIVSPTRSKPGIPSLEKTQSPERLLTNRTLSEGSSKSDKQLQIKRAKNDKHDTENEDEDENMEEEEEEEDI